MTWTLGSAGAGGITTGTAGGTSTVVGNGPLSGLVALTCTGGGGVVNTVQVGGNGGVGSGGNVINQTGGGGANGNSGNVSGSGGTGAGDGSGFGAAPGGNATAPVTTSTSGVPNPPHGGGGGAGNTTGSAGGNASTGQIAFTYT